MTAQGGGRDRARSNLAHCGIAVLALAAAAPAGAQCMQWDVSGNAVQLEQSHGGFAAFDLVLDGENVSGTAQTTRAEGNATFVLGLLIEGDDFSAARGTVDGVLAGGKLELQVRWSDGKMGVYDIAIDQHGRLSGSTYDFTRPANRANVIGVQRVACARAAAPPPPPRVVTPRDIATTGISGNAAPRLVERTPRITRAIGKRPAGSVAAGPRAVTGVIGKSASRCATGYVPRQAGPGDAVCVPPESRSRVVRENAGARARWVPGAYGPNTCAAGFVWREAFAGDLVCVDPGVRTLVRTENRLAASRVAK